MIEWDKVQYFARSEFKFHGDVEPHPELVYKLDKARGRATERAGRDVVFDITSGIRPPRKQRQQNGDALPGTHTTGHAVDIRARYPRDRYYILEAVFHVGFHRVGIYNLHIHVDVSADHDPDVAWLGRSE